jgi:hypothetical protein
MYDGLVTVGGPPEQAGTVRVAGPCAITGRHHEVVVPLAGWMRWRLGEAVQAAFPELPPAEREFLVSGISPLGWRRTFAPTRWDRVCNRVHAWWWRRGRLRAV